MRCNRLSFLTLIYTAVEMLMNIGKAVFDRFKDDDDESSQQSQSFTFKGKNGDDSYEYSNLYDEADEMLQVSMLIYSLTDLRNLAKDPAKKDKLKSPKKILDLPLTLSTCLQVLEENHDVMKEFLGEDDHKMTWNSLNLIHSRFEAQRALVTSSSNGGRSWLPFISSLTGPEGSVEVEEIQPKLTYFGDEKSDVDLVYAVGVDQLRKRITVAFRGSVTVTDFQKDAMISLNQQPNPVHLIDSHQEKEIGIHDGFYDYLLKRRENGTSKYDEIMTRVEDLFQESECHKSYKLYVTGHSLGGALATLFSLHAAAAANFSECIIPSPVSCISVASPRVGDRTFQAAFLRLEELGLLRHLRIANDRDPVTMMPSATAKRIWSFLSPISYIVFKVKDYKFEDKENFHHTGIKLGLSNQKWELSFLAVPMTIDGHQQATSSDPDESSIESESCRNNSESSTSSKVFQMSSRRSIRNGEDSKIPNVSFHMGNSYIENLTSVKTDLVCLSLNDLYQTKVSSIYKEKSRVHCG